MHGFETIGAISTAAVTLNRFGFFARYVPRSSSPTVTPLSPPCWDALV